MNRTYRKEKLKTMKLPLRIDSFTDTGNKGVDKYFVEYDGWYFIGATMKSVTNKLLEYIFAGGEE